MTNPERGDLTMPGIRLATTVAITYKAEDTMNDLPAVAAAEAFVDGLRADLAQAYGDVESIEVGDVIAAPPSADPRMELTVEWLNLARVALDDAHMAIVDLRRADVWQRAPRGMQDDLATSHERYMAAAAAFGYVCDRLRQEVAA